MATGVSGGDDAAATAADPVGLVISTGPPAPFE
jgi:hypothetical protein